MIKSSFPNNFHNELFHIILSLFYCGSVTGFQYWTMAQTWQAGFCIHKVSKFTVHGLWPSNYTGSQPWSCKGPNPNLNTFFGKFYISY